MSRYSRHIILSEVGPEGQDKLNTARVLVIGAGGLGCPVLQYLAAAGVGTIGIIDFDVVETSNLQRQVLFGTSALGRNKAMAAKDRLKDLNPTIEIKAYPEALTSKNAVKLFSSYDIIVDGSDNFSTRYLVNDAAILSQKPVVYGAIYKFEGQVSVFNYEDGPSYRCLFPTPPKEGTVANCAEVGVLGVLPGIIGTMMANEVIKIILGFSAILSGKLLCYDSRTTAMTTLKINRSDAEFEKILSRGENLNEDYQDHYCETEVVEISADEVLQMDNIQFVDVREFHEHPQLDLVNCVHIPLGSLDQNLKIFRPDQHHVLFCQTGARSKTAVKILQKHKIDKCYSLKGGVTAIIEQLKLNI